MSKVTAAACLMVATLAASVSAFEIGDTVVTVRECELKEAGVVIKSASVGEEFSVLGVDGRRLKLAHVGWISQDDVQFVSLKAAVEHYSRLIEKNPADWKSLCARGRAREEISQSNSGMKDLDEAVRLKPCCETYRLRGIAWSRRKVSERALDDFEEALRRDPKSTAALRNRALEYGKLGKLDKSLADINRALAVEPDSIYLLTCRVQILLDNNQPEKALADANAALRRTPTSSWARGLKGAALYELDQPDELLVNSSALLLEYPHDFEALMALGFAWYGTNHPDDAIASFTAAIKIRQNPAAYLCRGMLYSEFGDYSKAEDDFSDAIRRDPKQSAVWVARAMVRTKLGKTNEAIQDCDKAIKISPKTIDGYFARAIALYESGRLQEGLGDYEQMIRLRPDSDAGYLFRSGAYVELRRWKEALADLERALTRKERFGTEADVLAEAAFLRAACPDDAWRDPNTALKMATEAVKKSKGDSLRAQRALAAAHAALGDFAKATEAQKQAIKLAAQDKKAEEQQRLALYEAGKPFRFK